MDEERGYFLHLTVFLTTTMILHKQVYLSHNQINKEIISEVEACILISIKLSFTKFYWKCILLTKK